MSVQLIRRQHIRLKNIAAFLLFIFLLAGCLQFHQNRERLDQLVVRINMDGRPKGELKNKVAKETASLKHFKDNMPKAP